MRRRLGRSLGHRTAAAGDDPGDEQEEGGPAAGFTSFFFATALGGVGVLRKV